MSKGSARGPEGKTELPHKLGLREGAIDLKPRKMSCPFPRTVGSVRPWLLFSQEKGDRDGGTIAGQCLGLAFLLLCLSLPELFLR